MDSLSGFVLGSLEDVPEPAAERPSRFPFTRDLEEHEVLFDAVYSMEGLDRAWTRHSLPATW
jgi:hypothetical protein